MLYRVQLLVLAFIAPFVALADGDAPALPAGATPTAAPAQPGFVGMITPFLLMFGVVYFLMIRPQQKKMREHQNLLSNVKPGDEILTTSGILGKVHALADKVVTLEIDQNVRVKMLKSQIAQVVTGGAVPELNPRQ